VEETTGTPFKRMSANSLQGNDKRRSSSSVEEVGMDNVHLGDDGNRNHVSAAEAEEVAAAAGVRILRGKHFCKEKMRQKLCRMCILDNGEVIVTLLPVNERWPWVTPARFRPELVPEELMAPVLTLTVEEYVQTMEKLTTDMRFTLYNILYKRILILWIGTAFAILLTLLLSGVKVRLRALYVLLIEI